MSRESVTTAKDYLVTWTVDPGEDGMRLDHFLKLKYRRLSREYLQKAIKNERVTLNHQSSKPSRILRLEDKVYVLSVRGKEPEVNLDYKILFEDDTILVVDKPGDLPVHPSGRYFFNTLLTQLQIVNSNEVDQAKQFFMVHRIDRETSGVLVIGKTSAAAANLVEQFQARKTSKEYLAIVRGVMKDDTVQIDVPIGRHPQSEIRVKMHAVVVGADGKPLYLPESETFSAKTQVEVIERKQRFTLVKCKPHTGRQHQIRVHLDYVGHPIAGDKLYGQPENVFLENIRERAEVEVEPGISLARHALHAHKLSLTHPVTRKTMEFKTELPDELKAFWDKLD